MTEVYGVIIIAALFFGCVFSFMVVADLGRGYNIFDLPSNEEEDEAYKESMKRVNE